MSSSIRQHVAAVGRCMTTLGKGEEGLRQQLALDHVYHNFCLPHANLRRLFVTVTVDGLGVPAGAV